MTRTIILRIRRGSKWVEYSVRVPKNGYVLDALQEAQRADPSLVFRHACHHASCGSCGMRINGRERLACATTLAQAAGRGGRIRLEPLRNFPVIADLAVDVSGFLARMEDAGLELLRGDESDREFQPLEENDSRPFLRYENCIECGLCISACPIALTSPAYLGPAPLAGAERRVEKSTGRLAQQVLAMVNSDNGVWRCHSAFECTAVCPAEVDPGRAIMQLRRDILLSGGE